MQAEYELLSSIKTTLAHGSRTYGEVANLVGKHPSEVEFLVLANSDHFMSHRVTGRLTTRPKDKEAVARKKVRGFEPMQGVQ